MKREPADRVACWSFSSLSNKVVMYICLLLKFLYDSALCFAVLPKASTDQQVMGLMEFLQWLLLFSTAHCYTLFRCLPAYFSLQSSFVA